MTSGSSTRPCCRSHPGPHRAHRRDRRRQDHGRHRARPAARRPRRLRAGARRRRPRRRRGRRRPAGRPPGARSVPPRPAPTSTRRAWCWCARSPPTAAPAPTSAAAAAPVGVLAELAEHLVAVHGQADQWRLRRADQHREVLDGFGGRDAADALVGLPRACTASSPRPRPSWPTCARRAAERAREADAAARRASSASRPSTRSPARTPPWPSRASGSGTPRSCGPAAGAAHTALAGDDDAGMPAPGVLEALATASSRLASVQRQRPGAGRDRHPRRRAALPRRRRRRRPRVLPRRRRRRPRPPRAGRAAPGRARRA